MATKTTLSKKHKGPKRDPRELIIEVAEILIGKHGYAGVSLREISATAGMSNHSAVHYYFESKDGLIETIINHRSKTLDEDRKDLLGSLMKRGFEKDTRSILEAILLPIAKQKGANGECSYASFLLALRIFEDISHWRTIADSPDLTKNLYAMLRESLKPIPDGIIDMRFLAAFTMFLIAVVDWDKSKIFSQQIIPSREEYLQSCIDFAAAGMMATPRKK